MLEFLHVKPGKGSAFVRTKIKNLVNGSVQERTFRAGEQVASAEVNNDPDSRDIKQFTSILPILLLLLVSNYFNPVSYHR